MAFAGNDTYFVGIIGSDSGLLKDALVDKGVHIDYMKISNKPTGHAIIEVDQSGQNHILFVLIKLCLLHQFSFSQNKPKTFPD